MSMNALSKNFSLDGLSGHPEQNHRINGHAPPGGALAFRVRPDGASPPAQRPASDTNNRTPTQDDAWVGRRIKEERRAAGLTQKEIAQIVGVTGAQFHRYETGLTRVAASRLMSIAATLNIRPEALMGVAAPAPVKAPLPTAIPNGSDALLELVEVFASIMDPRRRHALLTMARMIATEERVPAVAPVET